jgi:DNA polymerase-3 subunit gamma/tau
MSKELYKVHRPKKLSQLRGQDQAVKVLNGFIKNNKIPHFLLLVGPSGCGKTTIARILKKKLKCGDRDFAEINAASERGIELVREIKSKMGLAPISGEVRIYLIDEAHQLTGTAEEAFLKMLEDTPDHVYFIFCTTNPEKLKKTTRTRASQIAVRPLNSTEMRDLLMDILEKEDKRIKEEIGTKIIEHSDGSPRRALQILDQVLQVEDEEDQLKCVQAAEVEKEGIEIARALLKPKPSWSEVAKLVREVTMEPEDIRWMILGYMTKVLLGGGKMAKRAYVVINCFRDNFYDCKKAGLAAACWEACG